ncbi:MAG: fimbrillin family protein [Bacteroidales bacterium]|nr:fimbrillin family protein [Bacteroidales bacterium]
MKRILYYLSAIAAACTLLLSCQQQETTSQPAARSEIKFTASVGTFAVKATDTALEVGDALGVSCEGITSFSNRRLVWDGYSLVPDEPVYWEPDQGMYDYSRFYAYYPYQEGMNQDDYYFLFSVQRDQSTHAAYTASDFMCAWTSATPATGQVYLQLCHQLSKMIIMIDNQLDSEVEEVFMGNLHVYVEVSSDLGIWWKDETDTIKAGKVTLADGSVAWVLIAAPGYTYPSLTVKMTDGSEYSYQLQDGIWMDMGGCRVAHVTLTEGYGAITEFGANVENWWEGGEFWFQKDVPSESGIVIDGDMSDWAGIEGAETPENVCKVMKVTNDANYFYVYLASEPGPRGDRLWGDYAGYYYLDFDWDNDESTGIAENNNPGFDCWCYLYFFGGDAENPYIKEHPNGHGESMSIDNLTAKGVITDELIEIELSIPRSDMAPVKAGALTRILSWRSKDGTKIYLNYEVK